MSVGKVKNNYLKIFFFIIKPQHKTPANHLQGNAQLELSIHPIWSSVVGIHIVKNGSFMALEIVGAYKTCH